MARALAIFVSLFVCFQCVQAATFYVSPSGNDGNSGGAGDPFLTLSRAIDQANTAGGSGVVTVLSGTYSGADNNNIDPATNSIVCESAGTCTIVAAGHTRVINAQTVASLSVNPATPPTISGFVFQGDTTAQGGVALIGSALLAFHQCIFTGPSSGVFINHGDAVTIITNSTFASIGQSAPISAGAAITMYNGTTTIIGGVFVTNKVHEVGGDAKGAAVYATAGSLSISLSGFVGNTANTGGAVWVGGTASITMNACMFTSNSVTGNGGAFHTESTGAVSVNGTAFDTNVAAVGGGAIHVASGTPSFTFLAVTGDPSGAASAASGGGVQVTSGAPTFSTSKFENLAASGHGGAVHIVDGTPSFTACYFLTSTSEQGGGGVCAADGVPVFTQCFFIQCNTAGSGGGLIAVRAAAAVLGTVFLDNVAGRSGGGLYLEKAPTGATQAQIVQSIFNGNTATTGGGLYMGDGMAVLTGCTIALNSAVSSGGGVSTASGPMTVANSTIIGNTAPNGGGLMQVGEASVYNIAVKQNGGFNAGGGIMDQSVRPSTYTDVVVLLNQASAGGGVFITTQAGGTTWVRAQFHGNKAADQGGGIFIFGYDHTFRDCVMQGNMGVTGGAMYAHVGTQTVTGGTIGENLGRWAGGLYMAGGVVHMTGVNCSYNAAANNGGCATAHGGQLFVTSITATSNRVAENGGAVYAVAGQVTIDTSTFVGNAAGVNGGAVGIEATGSVAVSGCHFQQNQAASWGGAVWTAAPLPSLALSTFIGNVATYGGALYLTAGCPITPLSAATFMMNGAAQGGGAVHFATNTLPCSASLCDVAQPCTFVNNQATYGADMSSPPEQLVIVGGVPQSVVPGEEFSPTLHVLDHFNQVVAALDGVTEAMLVFASVTGVTNAAAGSATLVGRTASAVRDGEAVMPDIAIVAPVAAEVQLSFTTQPEIASVSATISVALCPQGSLLNAMGDACDECPQLTFSWNPRNTTCDLCPHGASCYGGANVVPVPGYWHSAQTSAQFHRCLHPTACKFSNRMQTLSEARRNGSYVDNQCKTGFAGVFCGTCADEYYRSSAGECNECGSVGTMAVQSLLVTLVGVLFLAKTISTFLAYDHSSTLKHHNMVGQLIKIFISFLQLSALIRMMDLNWPGWLLQWMGWQQLAATVLGSGGLIPCLVQRHGLPRLLPVYINLLQPFGVCAVVWGGWSIAYAVVTRCGKYHPAEGRGSGDDSDTSPSFQDGRTAGVGYNHVGPSSQHVQGPPVHAVHANGGPPLPPLSGAIFASGVADAQPTMVTTVSFRSVDSVAQAVHKVNEEDGGHKDESKLSPIEEPSTGERWAHSQDTPGGEVGAVPQKSTSGGDSVHVDVDVAVDAGVDVDVSAVVVDDDGDDDDSDGDTQHVGGGKGDGTSADIDGVPPQRRGNANMILAAQEAAVMNKQEAAQLGNTNAPARRGNGRGRRQSVYAKMQARAGVATLGLEAQDVMADTAGYWHYMYMKWVPCVVITFFFLYPQTFTTAISVLHCVSGDVARPGQAYYEFAAAPASYLFSDTSVQCWEGPHVAISIVAVAVLIMWTVAPVACFLYLRANYRRLGNPSVIRVFGFVYSCYEPERYYYEFISILRKAVVVIIVELCGELGAGMQQQMYVAIIVISLAMHFTLNPFHDHCVTCWRLVHSLSLG